MLRAIEPTTLPPGKRRDLRIVLGGDMKNYIWTMNGQVFPKADPLFIGPGERVGVELVNDTMMWHPMHLQRPLLSLPQWSGRAISSDAHPQRTPTQEPPDRIHRR